MWWSAPDPLRHGNGTNDIFRDDPSVLFVSTHEDGSYPGTGKMADVGEVRALSFHFLAFLYFLKYCEPALDASVY